MSNNKIKIEGFSTNNLKFKTFDIINGLNLIYGVNGIGKTSLSKYLKNNSPELKNYEVRIFNEEYVLENVYISDYSGSKTDPKNAVNRANVYIGNDIRTKYNNLNNIKKQLNKINQDLRLIDQENEDSLKFILVNKFNIILSDVNFIKLINSQINKIIILKEKEVEIDDFNYNFSVDEFEEWLTKIINLNFLPQPFVQKTVDNFISKLVNKDFIKDASKKILEGVDVITDQNLITYKIDNKINNYISSNIKYIQLVNKYKEKNIILTDNEFKWIRDGMELQLLKDLEECFFCLNSKVNKDNFNEIINSKISTENKLLENFSNNILNLKNSLIKIKSEFKIKKIEEIWETDFEPLLQLFLTINEKLLNLKECINQNKSINLENIKYFSNPIDLNEILKNIHSNVANEQEIPIDFMNKLFLDEKLKKLKGFYSKIILTSLSNFLIKQDQDTNKEISNIVTILANSIKSKYDEYKSWFNMDLNYELNIQKANANNNNQEYKLVLEDKIKKDILKYLSSGERRKLSLIIFLAQLEHEIMDIKNENKKFILILDDPIDSSDFLTYLSFKNIVIKKIMIDFNKNIQNVILLTHNIDYALTQLIGSEKKEIDDINFFKINKNKKLNEREVKNIDYKKELLNDNQLLIRSFNQLYNSIKNNEIEDKIILNLYFLNALLVRKIDVILLNKYFSKNNSPLILSEKHQQHETLRIELKGEPNIDDLNIIWDSHKNCNFDNSIWKKVLSLYESVTLSFNSNDDNLKLNDLNINLNIEEIINIKNYTNSKIKKLLKNFQPLDHSEKAFKLVALSNIFKSEYKKDKIKIKSQLATFARHPNNEILKPIVALNDIFEHLDIEE